MDKNKAQQFIEDNQRHILSGEYNFTARQLALFRKLARELDVDEADVPMLLVSFSLQRIQQIENIDIISTMN